MIRSCSAPSHTPAAGAAEINSTSAAQARACAAIARPGSA